MAFEADSNNRAPGPHLPARKLCRRQQAQVLIPPHLLHVCGSRKLCLDSKLIWSWKAGVQLQLIGLRSARGRWYATCRFWQPLPSMPLRTRPLAKLVLRVPRKARIMHLSQAFRPPQVCMFRWDICYAGRKEPSHPSRL